MARVIYNNKKNTFFKELKADIDHYFTENKISRTGNWHLYSKSIILIIAAVSVYLFLLLSTYPIVVGILLSAFLGFLLASIGFNTMHDALHGSFSSNKKINKVLGLLTMHALGGNAFYWKQKHNIIHHTYTNVDNMDDDIAKSPLIRMCSTQRWTAMNRIQHLYTPFLYLLSSLFWVLLKDNVLYFSKTVSGTKLQKMNTMDHVIFWGTKVLYVLFYVLLPIYFLGVIPWLVGFLMMHLAMGFTLSIFFQLAHVSEETAFECTVENDSDITYIENEWAIHQIITTANFAPSNKVISWVGGGLNFQIEHHLFPKISHVHYPHLSKIVRAKCEKFGVQYNSFNTMSDAILSHFRFLKLLGKKPVLVPEFSR